MRGVAVMLAVAVMLGVGVAVMLGVAVTLAPGAGCGRPVRKPTTAAMSSSSAATARPSMAGQHR